MWLCWGSNLEDVSYLGPVGLFIRVSYLAPVGLFIRVSYLAPVGLRHAVSHTPSLVADMWLHTLSWKDNEPLDKHSCIANHQYS